MHQENRESRCAYGFRLPMSVTKDAASIRRINLPASASTGMPTLDAASSFRPASARDRRSRAEWARMESATRQASRSPLRAFQRGSGFGWSS